eukprot:gene24804-29974_t
MLEHWLELLRTKASGRTEGDSARYHGAVDGNGKTNGQDRETSRETSLRVVIKILSEVENTPLNIQDMRALRSSISEYLQVHGLQEEKELIRALQYRFSLDFLPGISTLGLQNYSKYAPEVALQISMCADDKEVVDMKSSPVPLKANDRPWANKPYLLCSIKRVQSALSTVYRMYIDGIKELDSKGELECFHNYEGAHVFMYATKTLKSGLPAHTFLYSTLDSKLWKDKQAVGKLIKAGNVYTLLPLVPATSSPPPSNLTRTSSGGDVEVTEGEEGTRQGSGNAELAAVAPPEEGGVLHRILSSPSPPLALSVQKRGVEKLLSLNVSIPTPAVQAASSSSSGSLLPILEQSLSSPPAPSASSVPPVTMLRSKLPHKGGGGFSIAFSKHSRVKAASRKNMVLEVSSGRGDFSPDPEHLPVLQMGKMDDDTFAVDFYDLSPMQAFSIALSVFDR